LVLWPKLFRRLVSYFKDHPDSGLAEFNGWPRTDSERADSVWISSRAEMGDLQGVLAIPGNKIGMQCRRMIRSLSRNGTEHQSWDQAVSEIAARMLPIGL